MLRVRALGPCTISGFQTLRSGDVCDVPAERREQVECLRRVGRVELLEIPPTPVAAEPSGKDAPADVDGSSPPHAALPDDPAEIARLEAELAKLEATPAAAPVPPKKPLFVCVCGKTAPEHAAGKNRLDDSACGGLKKFMQRAPAAP